MSGGDRKVREVDTLQGKKKRPQTELTSPSYEQNTKVGPRGGPRGVPKKIFRIFDFCLKWPRTGPGPISSAPARKIIMTAQKIRSLRPHGAENGPFYCFS